MEETIKKILDAKNDVQNLANFVLMHNLPQNLSKSINDKLSDIKDTSEPKLALDNLYKCFELLCFTISINEKLSEELSDSNFLKEIFLCEIQKKLDNIAYEIYNYAKSHITFQTEQEQEIRKTTDLTKLYNEFGINTDIFGGVNPEMLLPTEEYKEKPSVNATICEIGVKNTQNMVINVRSIVNSDYVKQNFANVNPNTGVIDKMVERYKILQNYPNKEKTTQILDSTNNEIFQQLDENVYRRLVHYPKNDYVHNLEFLPYNLAIVNFENKRILQMKKNEPKINKQIIMKDSLPGDIKNQVINKKKTVADGIFTVMYNEQMSDDEVLKLGIASGIIYDNMPKKEKQIAANFDQYINKRTLKKLF